MNKHIRNLKDEKGFTLVEIIAVLVILGVLAAVAIPKYMDMQDAARQKAARGAIAEIKGRCSSIYAQQLLTNNGNTANVTATTVHTTLSANNNNSVGGDFTLTTSVGTNNIVISVTAVQGSNLTAALNEAWTAPQ